MPVPAGVSGSGYACGVSVGRTGAAASSVGYQRSMGSSLRSTSVLIADGNRALRSLLAELLGDEPGFTVVAQVARAQDALDVLAEKPVDVVIIAERLDDVPGTAVLSRVRDACPDVLIALWASRRAELPDAADVLLDRGASFRELVRALRHTVRTISLDQASEPASA